MVLTILAILAALLIPALTGYIRKAKEKAIITEATDTWKAAQAAMSECYADKSNAQYLFTAPSGKNTWDTTFNDYFGKKYDSNAVLLQIFHTTDGKVVAINFGKDGYMVTIVPGKETTCVYNGKSLKSIEG